MITPEYAEAQRIAYAVIGVYALGVPLVYGILLRCARAPIIAKRETGLTKALDFLHNGYEPEWFGWELAVVMRKSLIIGWATLGSTALQLEGTLMQLLVVMLLVLAFMLLLVNLRPYNKREDEILAEVEQLVAIPECVITHC